jgi:hypothetical protein
MYVITVRRADAGATAASVSVDGRVAPDGEIALVDDGQRHEVVVVRPTSDR